MKLGRILGEVAAGSSNVYRIVFTGLLLWELVRWRFGRKKHEEVHHSVLGPGRR